MFSTEPFLELNAVIQARVFRTMDRCFIFYFLDLLVRWLEKAPNIFPKWWWNMVISTSSMVESVKHHQKSNHKLAKTGISGTSPFLGPCFSGLKRFRKTHQGLLPGHFPSRSTDFSYPQTPGFLGDMGGDALEKVSVGPPSVLLEPRIWPGKAKRKWFGLFSQLHVWYCWWFRNPAPVEVGSLSHYLQGFIHPRWCKISSINSIAKFSAKCREKYSIHTNGAFGIVRNYNYFPWKLLVDGCRKGIHIYI